MCEFDQKKNELYFLRACENVEICIKDRCGPGIYEMFSLNQIPYFDEQECIFDGVPCRYATLLDDGNVLFTYVSKI